MEEVKFKTELFEIVFYRREDSWIRYRRTRFGTWNNYRY